MTCSACGYANRRGARFCAACGTRSVSRCVSCAVELPADARFCDACGAAVLDTAPSAARKVVSVVFGDLVGSTQLQESLDPESVREMMSRFYDVMRAAVAHHGGRLEKFVGDGVVAVFGAPVVGEDDAVRAVRCADAMIADLAAISDDLEQLWDIQLTMRVGVDTGELVISADGELVGDTMNTAARLEHAAEPGEVLVGEATWRLVRHRVELEPVAPLVLRGKAAPVRAWRVRSVPTEDTDGRLADVPLVGRAGELRRLRAVFDRVVAAPECRLVTVVGSLGVGKTRLAQEFARDLRPHATVVLTRCEPTAEATTFRPVAGVLRKLAGIVDADPPLTVRAKLAALVGDDQEQEHIVDSAASVLGAAESVSVEETFWGIRRVLEAHAQHRPVAVILDDLHWAQPLLIDLLEHLVEWVRATPVLVMVLARPELREMRRSLTDPGGQAADVVDLAPLESAESRAFVAAVLGGGELESAVLDRILEAADGNPLFLGETLRMLVDEGSLVRQDDGWVSSGSGAVQVPPTVHALISARIERLRAEERAVIESASVIGKQFSRGAVAELINGSVRGDIDELLATLGRKEMVEPDGTYRAGEPVYRFRHVVIRDAAYRCLLKESRAELHERFADWMQRADAAAGDQEEVVAYHLEQAHEYRSQLGRLDEHGTVLGERAAAMLHSAGRRALARADHDAAANLLRRALRRTPREDPEVMWDLAETLLSAGDNTAAVSVVERMVAEAATDPRVRARAAVLAGELAVLTGALIAEETVESVSTAAQELTQAGDYSGAAKANHVIAQAQTVLGRFGAAESALERALVAGRRAADRRRITSVLVAVPRIATSGPSPVVRASGRCLDVLRILRLTPGNRHVEAITLRWQALLEAMRGRFDPARDLLAASRATLQELGLRKELHKLTAHAGTVELLAGDAAAAESLLRQARGGFAELGMLRSSAQAAALLGRALLEQGREEEALDQARVAEQHAGDDLRSTVTWCGVRAEILARRGDHDAAIELARRAVALAEPTDALTDRADAALTLAGVLRVAGDEEDARATAKAARVLYETKEHTVGAARAAAFCGETPDAPARPVPTSAVLGNRPPQRWATEFLRRWATGGTDAADLYSPDWRLVDHRRIGWGELYGIEQGRELLRSIMTASPDVHLAIGEVLACDDRVMAFLGSWRGFGVQGVKGMGDAEIPLGEIIVVEDGLLLEQHIYEPEDRRELLEAYTAMGGRPGVLGDRPPERVVAEYLRRWATGDADAVLELYANDARLVDHRSTGWSDQGTDLARELIPPALAASSGMNFEIDEVLACDDRVIAYVGSWRGDADVRGVGRIDLPMGAVEVVEYGRILRQDVYGSDERAEMLARYAELGGQRGALGGRPCERVAARMCRRFRPQDLDEIAAVFAPDAVFTDHRQGGREIGPGRDGIRERFRQAFGEAPHLHLVPEVVLACDDSVLAMRATMRCAGDATGGEFAKEAGYLFVVDDGHVTRLELFSPGDTAAILARFAELSDAG